MTRSAARLRPPRDFERFLRWRERRPEEERWEYIEGEPVLMAPASNRHSVIKMNVGTALRGQLAQKGWSVFIDGPEIRVPPDPLSESWSAIVPDVLVTCEPFDLEAGFIERPVVAIEIVSRSSERRDLGGKLTSYGRVRSLRHYLVLQQERRYAVHFSRLDDGPWQMALGVGPVIALEMPGASLTFDEAYAGTGV